MSKGWRRALAWVNTGESEGFWRRHLPTQVAVVVAKKKGVTKEGRQKIGGATQQSHVGCPQS